MCPINSINLKPCFPVSSIWCLTSSLVQARRERQPLLHGVTELRIATEPMLLMISDQVRKPATMPATREQAVDSEILERTPVPEFCPERAPVAEFSPERPRKGFCFQDQPKENLAQRGLLVPRPAQRKLLFPSPAQREILFPSSTQRGLLFPRPAQREFSPERAPGSPSSPEKAPVSKSSPKRDSVSKFNPERASVPKGSPESPEAHKCQPSNPLLPPPLLSSGSPSAHPQPTIYVVSSPRVCQSPLVLWLEDPLSPPQSLGLFLGPSTQAPSSPPWPGSPLAPPSSLIHLALPWSVIDHPAPPDSPRLRQAPPSLQLHLGLSVHASATVAGTFCSTLALRILFVILAHRLCRHWSAPWSRQPFLLHGSSFCRLHRGSPLWLWPESHLAPLTPSPSCRLFHCLVQFLSPVFSCVQRPVSNVYPCATCVPACSVFLCLDYSLFVFLSLRLLACCTKV
ncbi:DNA-directed RNA polymerase II subunit RPB1 [Labeo rohita]|uniref:DNA-directed RNA polymerase II subunit RPB1 n=1 Tax=Labeo rohita TaxID=84645 RepID=A0ABQ8MEY9_LABRO|nr:DNA-directed RNA polymerase II subunit RPB1 [Labeo rohita]